jgi:hypothetical protein
MTTIVSDVDDQIVELPGRDLVQCHLEQRFPEVDPRMVADAIHWAADATAVVKIQLIRRLLIEHRAADALVRRRRDVPRPPARHQPRWRNRMRHPAG